MNKDHLLKWLKERLEAKDKQIDRLKEDGGGDDSELICEWGIYNKIITEIEKGTFD